MQAVVADEDFEFDCPNKFFILPTNSNGFRSAEEQTEIDQTWFTVSHELPEVKEKESTSITSSLVKSSTIRRNSAGRLSHIRSAGKVQKNTEDVVDDAFTMFDKKYGGTTGNGSNSMNDKENASSMGNSVRRTSSLMNNTLATRSLSANKKRPASAIASNSNNSSNGNTARSNSVERRPLKIARPAVSVTSTSTIGLRTKTPSRIVTGPGCAGINAATSTEKRSISCGSTSRRPLSAAPTTNPSSSSVKLESEEISTRDTVKRTTSRASTDIKTTTPTTTAELKAKLAEVKPKIYSQHSTKKGTANNTATNADKSLELLLKQHNARFAPVPAYEPPRHSVRDVRRWEKISGKIWNELKPEDREKANEEISIMKATGDLQ